MTVALQYNVAYVAILAANVMSVSVCLSVCLTSSGFIRADKQRDSSCDEQEDDSAGRLDCC